MTLPASERKAAPDHRASRAGAAPREMRALAALALGGAIVGVVLTGAVSLGLTDRWDIAIARSFGLSANPDGDPRLREAIRDITALGSFSVLTAAILAAAGFLLAARRPALAGITVASALLATGLSTSLKLVIARARPALVEAPTLTFTASFPSGHALLSASIILMLGGMIAFAAHRRAERVVIMVVAALLSILIGVSRVWLGVHWPSDVLAGWAIGIAWAAATLLVARRFTVPG